MEMLKFNINSNELFTVMFYIPINPYQYPVDMLWKDGEVSPQNTWSSSFCWHNLYKLCLFYPSWETTSHLRPPLI